VWPVEFLNITELSDINGYSVTYKVNPDANVDQNKDRLKVQICKSFGNRACDEKDFFIANSVTTLQIPDSLLIGEWEFTLFHIKTNEISAASNKKTLIRSKF